MIIHSINAKNVLRYETLELNDLPAEGIIAISGFNESGKSTIGETICFALFGRTFSISEDELGKIIRWGESDCSVTIQFTNDKAGAPTGEQYALTRMLDCDGNHSAKLYKVYDEENPLARGIERTEEALYQLTGVEFEEFIESFYLAQREITTPHPHSYALKTMAGIATMEYCSHGIHEDIEQDIAAADELRDRIARLQGEVVDLEIDDHHLDALTAQHEQVLQNKAQTEDSLGSYNNTIGEYTDAVPKLSAYLKKKGRSTFWRFLSFILALASFALWWLLEKMPDSIIHDSVSNFLQTNLPQFGVQHYPYLLYAGVFFAILFLIFWAAIISHKGNIDRLSAAGSVLAEKMQTLDAERGIEADETRGILINSVASNQIEEQELSKGTAADLAFFSQQQENQSEQLSELSSAVTIERDRLSRVVELEEKMVGLQDQIAEKESRNHIRRMSSELLAGANGHLSNRFNHIIREHVSKTLPLFTENRYQHLQIDGDLTVRVFSNEKHDFMELDEISSGTQRQIMLAVRLALSQEMVSRKVQSHQFLILDEPFAFFDAERTEKSLAVLPQLSDDLPQIWIIAQSFPEAMNFDRTIYCARDAVAKIV